MEKLYKVVNSSRGIVIGTTDVDGEAVEYSRPAVTVEMIAAKEHDGSVKLVFTGKELEDGLALTPNSMVRATFVKVD